MLARALQQSCVQGQNCRQAKCIDVISHTTLWHDHITGQHKSLSMHVLWIECVVGKVLHAPHFAEYCV